MRIFLLIILIFVPHAWAASVLWPIAGPILISCNSGSSCYYPTGTMYRNITLRSSGSSMAFVDIDPTTRRYSTSVKPFMLRCGRFTTNSVGGQSYLCQTVRGDRMGLTSTKCELKSLTSWELTSDSTCSLNSTTLSNISTSPGGECIFFGTDDGRTGYGITGVPYTITMREWDFHDQHCAAMIPPEVSCTLTLPNGNVIDHGISGPTGGSRRELGLDVQCGSSPLVYVLGSEDASLGAGVSTRLSIGTAGGAYSLISDLTISAAAPGDYHASVVVVVAPS